MLTMTIKIDKKSSSHNLIVLQLNLVVSNSAYSKFWLSQNLSAVQFKLSAFQLNLLLLSQISMCRNLRFLKETFQFLTYKFIQILFAVTKLSIKSINKPVKVSTAWPVVFTM